MREGHDAEHVMTYWFIKLRTQSEDMKTRWCIVQQIIELLVVDLKEGAFEEESH